MKKIIVIVGPTGVGKTKLSVELAKKLKGEVINADSMQVYIGLDIGTAKIKEVEKEGIKHHLFDIIDVHKNYTIFNYQKDARKVISEIIRKRKTPILVGGSGLYIKAALYDYKLVKEKFHSEFDNLSNEELLNEIRKDHETDIHVNNRKRLVRELNKIKNNSVNISNINEPLYDNNINTKAIQTGIGYKELYEYFKGHITLEEAINLIKKNSRNYAKRQYTFFNHQMDVTWFNTDYDNFDNTVNEVYEYILNLK